MAGVAALRKEVGGKKGVDISPRAIIAFVLLIAAAVVLFIMFKGVLCRTGIWAWSGC